VRIAIDLKLFEIISQSKSTSLDEIMQKVDADPMIVQRILRAVSSMGFIQHTAVTTWEPSPLTHLLNVPGIRDWLIAHHDERIVALGKFPAWLKKRGYKTTGSIDDNLLTELCGTDIWTWLDQNPEKSAIFDSAMSIQESFPKEMRPPYPFSEDIGELRTASDAVTLVDIGGGFGQAIKAIRAEYPHVKGRFILQDLPKTIGKVDASQAEKDGFEIMKHDFFTPQPVKGAKYYLLRRVLHDWNDEPSIKILQATHAAMKETPEYSRLLIHESVIKDVGAPFPEPMIDLIMRHTCDGMERTEAQWHELLGKSGFKIVKIWRPDEGFASVIEAVVA
jgi:demethylsterigmatocystin 6-O-methyltransferase